jgi:hypothetical protein
VCSNTGLSFPISINILLRTIRVEGARRMIVNAFRLLAIVLVQFAVQSAAADTSDCRDALDRYNSAHVAVVGASKGYTRCVSSYDWHEDCSLEFATLQSAHDKFEAAVANLQSGCS